MSKFLPLFPFAAALSLLACQNEGPVADNLVTPPEGMVGDQSATGLAKPVNAAAAEAVDRAALPPTTAGMAWLLFDDGRAARFGPAGRRAGADLRVRDRRASSSRATIMPVREPTAR